MAIQSQFYLADGTTRTYVATKPILTKAHVRVFLLETSTGIWEIAGESSYELINNSIVMKEAYGGYKVEVRVADTEDELSTAPSAIGIVAEAIEKITTTADNIANIVIVAENDGNIKIVAGSIADVNILAPIAADISTVAGISVDVTSLATIKDDITAVNAEPLRQSILDAGTNATNAQLEAWKAQAEKMTADSYATEPEDTNVVIYTSVGDGTFTPTTTTEYSSLHYSKKGVFDRITYRVATVTELLGLAASDGEVCVLTDKDRGGIFVYDSAAIDDDGIIFGKWVRQYSGAVNVKWFGAKTDDSAFDNSDILQHVFNNFVNIYMPKGSYYITKEIRVQKHIALADEVTLKLPTDETLNIHGDNRLNTRIICNYDTLTSGTSLLYLDGTNNYDTSTAYYQMVGVKISNISLVGNGALSQYDSCLMESVWGCTINNVDFSKSRNGLVVGQNSVDGADDRFSLFYTQFNNCSFIINKELGFKCVNHRMSQVSFDLCTVRSNLLGGMHFGGAGVIFSNGSISINGADADIGYGFGAKIEKPSSGSKPRAITFKNNVFEANYDIDLWFCTLMSGSVLDNVFTPFELLSRVTTHKCISIFEKGGVDANNFIRNLHIDRNRVQEWSITDGSMLHLLYSEANYGILDNNSMTNFSVTNSLNAYINGYSNYYRVNLIGYLTNIEQFNTGYKYKVKLNKVVIADATSGTKYLSSLDTKVSNELVSSPTMAYPDIYTNIPKSGMYRVSMSIPVTGITANNNVFRLYVSIGGIVVALKYITVESASYTSSVLTMSEVVYIERNASTLLFILRSEGTDTDPIVIDNTNGNMFYSLEEV